MSPKRRSRRSSTLGVLILIGAAALAWYLGAIPGLPKPETIFPQIKNFTTLLPNLDEIGTFLPDVPDVGTQAPQETSAPASSAGGLPEMAQKPEPRSSTFQGCPPEGDGGDPQSNFLKNRVDEGNYVPVTFDAIVSLSWPQDVEGRDRENWSSADAETIARYEGIPVMVEGYLTAATTSGTESTNCHATDGDMLDWHVSLVKNPGEDRALAIVTETTPRIRANHKWSLDLLQPIIENQERVRISGWLFFDPEHPDHIGQFRATLWEVHPIMQIEIFRDNRWIALDDLAN